MGQPIRIDQHPRTNQNNFLFLCPNNNERKETAKKISEEKIRIFGLENHIGSFKGSLTRNYIGHEIQF